MVGLDVDNHDYFVSPDRSRSLIPEPFRALAFSRSEAGRIYDGVNRRYEARYEIAGSRLIATATVLSRRSDHGVTPLGWHVNFVVTPARRPR